MPSTINLDNGAQVANISLDSAGNLDFNFNNTNDTRVSINDDNGIVTIGGGQGGQGRTGGLQLLNASGVGTIFLGDEGGNILLGGLTVSGALAPRCLRRRVWDDGASCLGGECGSLSK